MSAYKRIGVVLVLVLVLVFASSSISAADSYVYLPQVSIQTDQTATAAHTRPMPPLSHAFGKSLTEWQTTYWEWWIPALNEAVNSGDVTADRGTKVDNMFLLPVYELLEPFPKVVEAKPGTSFMLPLNVLLGFGYLDEAGNTIAWDVQVGPENFINATTEVTLTLDEDNVLLCYPAGGNCKKEADLAKFYTSGNFDSPYFVPLFGENVIWFEGLGVVLPPLPPGEHTLNLVVDNHYSYDIVDEGGEVIDTVPDHFACDNTWDITITPPGLAEKD